MLVLTPYLSILIYIKHWNPILYFHWNPYYLLYLINHWNPILYFINHWNPILWLKKYHIHPPSPSQISASCSSWLQQHWARQEPNSFVSLFHHYITFGHGKKNILCVLSTLIKLCPHRDGQENLVPLLSCSSMMYRLHTCLSHLVGLKFLVVPISSCPQTAQTCLHRASRASEPWLDLEGREESSHEMQQQPTHIRSKNLIGSKIKKWRILILKNQNLPSQNSRLLSSGQKKWKTLI